MYPNQVDNFFSYTIFFTFSQQSFLCQFCRIGKDSNRNGDRMSDNDEKLPYLQWVTKKCFFFVSYEKHGTLSIYDTSKNYVTQILTFLPPPLFP